MIVGSTSTLLKPVQPPTLHPTESIKQHIQQDQVGRIIPNEVYLIQSCISQCTKSVDDILKDYKKRNKKVEGPIVHMIAPVSIMSNEVTNFYSADFSKQHSLLKDQIPPDLLSLENGQLLIQLWLEYIDDEHLNDLDEVYMRLHAEEKYSTAYKNQQHPNYEPESSSIGDGVI